MATPMVMMAPISEGTLKVVCVTKSIQRMPQKAPGIAIRMMSGSSQHWKFTAISRYTSTMAKTMPMPRRRKESFMVLTSPRSVERGADGQALLRRRP